MIQLGFYRAAVRNDSIGGQESDARIASIFSWKFLGASRWRADARCYITKRRMRENRDIPAARFARVSPGRFSVGEGAHGQDTYSAEQIRRYRVLPSSSWFARSGRFRPCSSPIVRDLLNCTPEDLLNISNFGEKTLEEVYQALADFGFPRKKNQLAGV